MAASRVPGACHTRARQIWRKHKSIVKRWEMDMDTLVIMEGADNLFGLRFLFLSRRE
jgi:hypothetical protein